MVITACESNMSSVSLPPLPSITTTGVVDELVMVSTTTNWSSPWLKEM